MAKVCKRLQRPEARAGPPRTELGIMSKPDAKVDTSEGWLLHERRSLGRAQIVPAELSSQLFRCHGVLSHRTIQPAYLVNGHQLSLRCSQVCQIHARPWCICRQRDHRLSVCLEPVCTLDSQDSYTGPAEVDILRVHGAGINLRCPEHKRPCVDPPLFVWHGPPPAKGGQSPRTWGLRLFEQFRSLGGEARRNRLFLWRVARSGQASDLGIALARGADAGPAPGWPRLVRRRPRGKYVA